MASTRSIKHARESDAQDSLTKYASTRSIKHSRESDALIQDSLTKYAPKQPSAIREDCEIHPVTVYPEVALVSPVLHFILSICTLFYAVVRSTFRPIALVLLLLLLHIIITYDTIKVTLHSKLLQGHCTEFEFDDVHTLYANLAVRR